MIGDLAITLYRGLDQSVREHLAVCLDITSLVVAFAEVGMEFRELYEYASKLIRKAGLTNQTFSLTDTDGVDIGHTVPWSYGAYPQKGQFRFRQADRTEIGEMVSSHRVFLNRATRLKIQPTMAFTIEPRLGKANAFPASFHTIVVFVQGAKQICTEFRPLFSIFEMDEYLPADALAKLNSAPSSQ